MNEWTKVLRHDPVPSLLGLGNPALAFFTRRDLLDEEVGPVEVLWELPDALKLVSKQQENGSWRYKGSGPKTYPHTNYDLLETFRNLRILVGTYGFHCDHPSIQMAAEYVFSCQTEEGDIRGIIGNQYMPYYHGEILAQLITAGCDNDPRIRKGLEWLLTMCQDDGGWIVPAQAVPAKDKTDELWGGEPIPPDRTLPFSHLATGMVLRAFAAHPDFRDNSQVRGAARLLKSRFFKADKYNDRKGPQYWLKLQFPFWWSNLLTALDSLTLLGFSVDDEQIKEGLDWFVDNQDESGLWPTGYGKGRKTKSAKAWVGLAVCRVFRRVYA